MDTTTRGELTQSLLDDLHDGPETMPLHTPVFRRDSNVYPLKAPRIQVDARESNVDRWRREMGLPPATAAAADRVTPASCSDVSTAGIEVANWLGIAVLLVSLGWLVLLGFEWLDERGYLEAALEWLR